MNPNESNRFYVGKYDIIKFGRVRFRIKKLHIAEEDGESPHNMIPGLNEHVATEENEPEGVPVRGNRTVNMARNMSSVQHSTFAGMEGFS